MKISDALSILDLASGATAEEVKAAYKAAVKKYHPDINPAGEEMMKLVNAAFEALKSGKTETDQPTQKDFGEELNIALNAIIDLPGLDIEICGAWIWVGGDTRAHKEALKGAGFRWANKKKRWNFRPANWKSSSRGNWDMSQIRETHGSYRPDRPFRNQLEEARA